MYYFYYYSSVFKYYYIIFFLYSIDTVCVIISHVEAKSGGSIEVSFYLTKVNAIDFIPVQAVIDALEVYTACFISNLLLNLKQAQLNTAWCSIHMYKNNYNINETQFILLW